MENQKALLISLLMYTFFDIIVDDTTTEWMKERNLQNGKKNGKKERDLQQWVAGGNNAIGMVMLQEGDKSTQAQKYDKQQCSQTQRRQHHTYCSSL